MAILTRHAFPVTFYAGDVLGSFNSWLRLLTGVLFAFGAVWFVYPWLQNAFTDMGHEIEEKFKRANLAL